MTNKKFKRPRRRGVRKDSEIPTTALKYVGPIRTISEMKQDELKTVTLANYQFLSSSGAGVLATVFGNTPAGFPDWGNLASVYHEYRILGLSVHFHPNNRYSKTTTICRPGVLVKDRNSSGSLSSYSLAVAHSSARIISIEDFFSANLKMDGVEDAGYKATSAVAADNWIKIYFDGLSFSTEYGMTVEYIRVQFRGRL